MSKTLTKKKASLLNMALMGTYQIVTALFGFVLPSMILNTYGANLHGYTTTVSNIMSYVALVNAGLAPAAVQALYEPLAKKDMYRVNQVLNAVDHFYTISGWLYNFSCCNSWFVTFYSFESVACHDNYIINDSNWCQ